MISNTTTSLDPKNSYTSADKLKSATNGPPVKSDPVTETIPVPKEEPVVAKDSAAEPTSVQPDKTNEQREEFIRRVTDAIPKVRELMQKNQRSLDFEVAERENRVIITVIDKETEKVIRQIPPEDVLQIAEAIDQGLTHNIGGLIFNSRA